MEIQVENHGTNFDLKLFSYGFGSFISVSNLISIFQFKVMFICI